MKKVAIMTDTTAQMSKRMADEWDIRLVPLYVIMDGTSHPETEIDLSWFCKELPKWKKEGKTITTSAPSVGDFLEAYRELRQKAEAVLDISLSSKFSATFSSAIHAKKIAQDETPETPFEIVDTFTVCGGQMLVAIEAARAAATGKSLSEVVEQANTIVRRANNISLSSDISFMAKCGRLHQARHLNDSRVSNTVLMEATMATGGENKPLGRYATRKQAMKRIIEILEERGNRSLLHVVINHADAPAEASYLRDQVLSRLCCQEIFICQDLPLVSYHEGLGNLKLCWWSED